jgi:hypothetical protein
MLFGELNYLNLSASEAFTVNSENAKLFLLAGGVSFTSPGGFG